MPGASAVRDATPADAAACAAIYAPYVRETPITFEEEPPDAAAFAGRIARAQEHHAWLVLERDGHVVGYAYGGRFKERRAYAWACEVSVYLARDAVGRGGGRALYEVLLARLADLGYRVAFAGMTLPNAASEALHRRLGFADAGALERVGFKHGAWHDVAWLRRELGEGTLTAPGSLPGPASAATT